LDFFNHEIKVGKISLQLMFVAVISLCPSSKREG